MKTGKGVIQGYDGVALTDARHQVVVHAQAYGEAQEHGLAHPDAGGGARDASGHSVTRTSSSGWRSRPTAGFHSEANVKYLVRHRGGRLPRRHAVSQARSALCHGEPPRADRADRAVGASCGLGLFRPCDFIHDRERQDLHLPGGAIPVPERQPLQDRGAEAVKFTGAKRVCGPCPLRAKCLRHPDKHPGAPGGVLYRASTDRPETYTAKMKRKIDTEHGPLPIWKKARGGRTGVRQRVQRPWTQTLQPPRPQEGQHPVAALLPGAQHRQGAALRKRRATTTEDPAMKQPNRINPGSLGGQSALGREYAPLRLAAQRANRQW